MRTPLVTALTILILFDALSWSLGSLYALRHAFIHHDLPTISFFKALAGPFLALGLNNLIVAGLLFVAISAMKILAAYWIWHTRMDGVVLQLILLGLSTIFWYGFDLPLGWLEGAGELVLIILTWNSYV